MRTIIIGMNKPLFTDFRLWRLLEERTGDAEAAYLQRFDRRKLMQEAGTARASAVAMEHTLYGRRVIVLGAEVRNAFGLPPVLAEPVVERGVVWRQLPHPSGRSRWYNDPKNRALAGLLLEEEMAQGVVR